MSKKSELQKPRKPRNVQLKTAIPSLTATVLDTIEIYKALSLTLYTGEIFG